MNPFRSLHEYEEFIYTLPHQHPSIQSSTLVVVRRGAAQVTVSGELDFADGYKLVVRERLTAEIGAANIPGMGGAVLAGLQALAPIPGMLRTGAPLPS